jgi:putative tryptophan/tyrosine transport system substrate-binding protein
MALARSANLEVEVLHANTDREIEAAFEIASRKRVEALVLAASPFFDTRRDKLVALAAGHALCRRSTTFANLRWRVA